MYEALHISPMMPSYNIKETTAFLVDLLGFTVYMGGNGQEYTIVHKDYLSIHILNAGADIGEMEFYLEVDNVDDLWETIKDKLNGIKVREPFDREYGMREMHLVIPQTKTLLFIGQIIKKQTHELDLPQMRTGT